ncbi:hypothetical protein OHR68_24560 [Spirillospora sp. NBC_00431]
MSRAASSSLASSDATPGLFAGAFISRLRPVRRPATARSSFSVGTRWPAYREPNQDPASSRLISASVNWPTRHGARSG